MVEPVKADLQLIEATSSARPDWTDKTPDPDGRFYYFVATSEMASTQAHAQDMAGVAALKKAATYCGVAITGTSERVTESKFKASETADPAIEETQRVVESARAYFSRFRDEQWYIEHFAQVDKKWYGRKRIHDHSYRASVLISIPSDEINSAILEARRRHQSPEELVSMDDLKAKEAEILARIQKIRDLINQTEKNAELEQKAKELEAKSSELEERVKAGVKSSEDLTEIMRELELTEKTAAVTFSGGSLFEVAAARLHAQERQIKLVGDLADYVAKNLYEIKFAAPEIETTHPERGTADIAITAFLHFNYETIKRMRKVFDNLKEGDEVSQIYLKESPAGLVENIRFRWFKEAGQIWNSYKHFPFPHEDEGYGQTVYFHWEVTATLFDKSGTAIQSRVFDFGGWYHHKPVVYGDAGFLRCFQRNMYFVTLTFEDIPVTQVKELREVKITKKMYWKNKRWVNFP